jgi:uncharacterized protein (TIGR02099 family)
MKRLYHFSLRTTRRLLILLIVLSALLILLGRLLAPLATQYRAEVEEWASDLMGQPVAVGRLQGSWRGLGPVLVLHDLQLFNPRSQRPSLHLKEVRITIGLLDSLRQLSPVVRKVAFISPRLRVTRLQDGAITIGNLDQLNELNPDDGSAAFLLPTHLSLEKGEVIWEDQMVQAPPLRLTDVNLNLRNGGTRHQLNGSVSLPGEHQGRIELAIDLHGQLDKLDSWSARSYMQSSGIDLAFLLNGRVADKYRFNNRRAEIKLWGEWNQDGLISLEGTTQWEQVAITRQAKSALGAARTLQLDHAAGMIRLQRQPTGWRLDLVDLQIKRNGREWPRSQVGVIAEQDTQGYWRFRAGSSRLRLEDIHAISTLFPLPDSGIEQMLRRVAASGSLNNLRLDYRQQAQGDRWSASGEIAQFTSSPWRGLPGVRNLPLRFWMDARQGTISLDATDVALDFADLFRAPLRLRRLQGDLDWQHQPAGDLVISSARLLAENDDIHTLSRLQLTIPAPEQGPLFLDLQSDFWDGDARTTHRYLPTAIMPERVVEWVDRSIGSGHVTQGSALVRGPLADFPFTATRSGRFEVFFNVANLQLDYWPEWPALSNLNADVRFLNNSFDAWASSGEILESRLTAAHARIDQLAHTSPLELTGSVEGPFSDHLRLLRESPLRVDFAPRVKDLEGKGETRLNLTFRLPIVTAANLTLGGRLSFLDTSLQLKEWQLSLSDIRGDLQFDQKHLFAKGITGRVFGRPVRIDVSTPEANPDATRVTATGNLPVATLQQQLPTIDLGAFAAGSSQWQLDLDIPHFAAGPDAPVAVRVSSDLVGIGIDQPAPLGKAAEATRPLLLQTRLNGGPEQPLHIRYGDQVDMALAIDRSRPEQLRLRRGAIVLGGARATLPQAPGLELTGRLERLQLEPWLERIGTPQAATRLPPLNRLALEIGRLEIGGQVTDQVRVSLNRGETHWEGDIISDWAEGGILLPLEASPSATVSARLKRLRLDPWLELLGGSAPDTGTTAPQRLLLTADQLLFKQATVADFSLDLTQRSGDWNGHFSSSHFAGDIRVPRSPLEAPINLTLDHLNLHIDDSLFEGEALRPRAPGERLDPKRIPAVEAQISRVTINDQPFGRLQLITQRRDNGLALQTLSLNSERLQLSASGSWQADPSLASSSRLDLSVSSRDLGAVLQDLQLSTNVDGAAVEIDSRLDWRGTPLDFSTRRLNGQLGMQIGKGRFLKVDPGVGRLFGLFNLGALRRRLTLDFSDIFKKGFTFDSIEGTFLLDEGDAYTNDFRMQGPSANIELSGRIGLGAEDFDALVTITPKISSSIPLAGAIAGGPAVGAALFIAQQLMGDSIDRATRLEYMATGSWDDPVLTPKTRDNPRDNPETDQHPPADDQNTSTGEPEPAEEPGGATDDPVAAPITANGEQTASGAATPDDSPEQPTGLFSRLLDKITPTGPTYPPAAPEQR